MCVHGQPFAFPLHINVLIAIFPRHFFVINFHNKCCVGCYNAHVVSQEFYINAVDVCRQSLLFLQVGDHILFSKFRSLMIY